MPAEVVPIGRRRNPIRPQPRGEQRRRQLLAALSSQLERQPLAEVSIAAVADASGLARSAFYFYFSSKNEAVTYLLSDIFDEQIAAVSATINSEGDPRDTLALALEQLVQSWLAQRTQFQAMLDARDADIETRQIWEAWLRRYEDFVADYIDEHAESLDVDSHDLAHSLISLNERVLERFLRSDNDGLTADRVHAALVHIWSASLFGGHR